LYALQPDICWSQ